MTAKDLWYVPAFVGEVVKSPFCFMYI